MPELPEVEHVVRALRPRIVGRRILATEISLPKLIAPTAPVLFNRKLKGATITGVSRRGKFILLEILSKGALARRPRPRRAGRLGTPHRANTPAQQVEHDLILAVHLRMTGSFLYLSVDDELPKHAHAIFYFENERRLVFRDQRKFGLMKLVARSRLVKTKGISELAPEPFSDDFSLEYLKEVFSRSRRTLKTLLLDQTKVLGLGNIYAAEALFRAGVNPFKPAAELSSRRVPRLHQAIRDVLRAAISGSSTSRIDLENPNGVSYGEAFGKVWQVYEREGESCFKCDTRIRRKAHGGRSTYWCPKCQRR